MNDISSGWMGQCVDYRERIELLFVRSSFGDITSYAKPVVFEMVQREPGTMLGEGPTLSLTREEGRQIMQILWDAGIRPNDGAGSTAESNSLRNHIKLAESVVDRVFKLLEQKNAAAV